MFTGVDGDVDEELPPHELVDGASPLQQKLQERPEALEIFLTPI